MYIVKKNEFGYNDVDDDFVVFNLVTGSYSLLNTSSKEIWLFIKDNEKVTVEQIIEHLLNIYEIEKSELTEDVNTILKLMLEQGLVCEE